MPTLTPKGGFPAINVRKEPKTMVINGAKVHVVTMTSGGGTQDPDAL